MGRYDRYTKKPGEEPDSTIHPVWRGIGCFFVIIIPIMAYAGSSLLVDANLEGGWVRIPAELARTVTIPFLAVVVPFLYAKLAVAVLLTVLGFGILSIIYSIMYSAVGPPKYGPTDAPPPKRTKKKRRR